MSGGGKRNAGGSSSGSSENDAILRQLVAQNRNCFDCGQRGPSYVNVTVGSFVCMACSGLLRGLTPPHRVKSISMASFTKDEIELLKQRGNEYCAKVWLATYTPPSGPGQNLQTDRNALRAHLSAKYEQKRYYLPPTSSSATNNFSSASAATTSNSNSLSNSTSFGAMTTNTQGTPAVVPKPVPSPVRNHVNKSAFQSDINIKAFSSSQSVNSGLGLETLTSNINYNNNNNNNNTFVANFDKWELDQENFANFDEASRRSSDSGVGISIFPASGSPTPTPVLPMSLSFSSSPLKPAPAVAPTNFPAPAISSSGQSGGGLFQANFDAFSVPAGNAMGGEDKYAALKDLDELFKSPQPAFENSTNSNSTMQCMSGSLSVPVNLSSISQGNNSINRINPFSQTLFPGGSTNNPFFSPTPSGSPATGSSAGSGVGMSSTIRNPFATNNATNPFL